MTRPHALRSLLQAGLAACSMIAIPGIAHATTYTVTNLGSISTQYLGSETRGINAAGHVAGFAHSLAGYNHAALYRNGKWNDLGAFAGLFSFANAINNADQVVGYAYNASSYARPFLWQNGTLSDLGIFTNYTDVEATAINNFTQIVGFASSPIGGGPTRAWVWQNGHATDLGTLGGAGAMAWGINDNGQIVGTADTAAAATAHAFLWQNGVMNDLGGLPGGTFSEGVSINTSGQVVGVATVNGTFSTGDRHATLWKNGAVIDLGVPPDAAARGAVESFADGINSAGTIVGGSGAIAYVYQGGAWTNLNTVIPANSGVTLTSAIAINDNGQIAAQGTVNRTTYGFLLTPVSP